LVGLAHVKLVFIGPELPDNLESQLKVSRTVTFSIQGLNMPFRSPELFMALWVAPRTGLRSSLRTWLLLVFWPNVRPFFWVLKNSSYCYELLYSKPHVNYLKVKQIIFCSSFILT